MINVLITAPYNEKGRTKIQNHFGKVTYRSWKAHGRGYNEQELIDLIQQTEADALITEHDQVTEKVIKENSGLQFIGVCRGTPSNVSLETAKALDIPVFNTPARNAQAVAEMFISNVIYLLRNTSKGVEWLEGEQWEEGTHTSYLQFKGNELAGKTIGIVGFGAIGQRIAHMVQNFPCAIQYYDPFLKENFPQYKKTTLEEVFTSSDIVSVHLPVNDNTRAMIDKELFSLMKPDAVFVNTARAVVVNREDLLDVLKKKKIRGAVLDVYDNEPPDRTDYELIHMPAVLATPHIAGATFEVEDHHVNILNEKLFSHFSQSKSA